MPEEHFDISAAVVRQLGEELISDEVTALVELVKNSYDADANYASVIVDTAEELPARPARRGTITIEDDGFGMTREEIRRGWLTISLSLKRDMKRRGETTPRGRTPLGDKGLGRLSTQRLGETLEMLTRKDGSATVYRVAFHWSDFSEEQLLSEVDVQFDELPPSARKVGTTIRISGLRNTDEWVGRRRDALVRRLSQLVFPFGSGRTFRVFMSIDGQRIDLEGLVASVREAAVGRFEFDFDGNRMTVQGRIQLSKLKGPAAESTTYHRLLEADGGRHFFQFLTAPENNHRLAEAEYIGKNGWFIAFERVLRLDAMPGVAYEPGHANAVEAAPRQVATPGPFHGEIDEFQLRGTDLEDVAVFDKSREFANYIKAQSGVRIFRNGFGIRPYGFDGNDWLNLGAGQTAGRSYYGLRPNNVIGYVALSESHNQQLREKTDREGLIATPYSHNFFALMERATETVNLAYAQLRRSYVDYRSARGSSDKGFHSIRTPISEMRKAATAAGEMDSRSEMLSERITAIAKTMQSAERYAAQSEDQRLGALLTEVAEALDEARHLLQELRALLPQAHRLSDVADYLEPKISALETQIEEFSELASLGLIAEALSHEIHHVADGLAHRTRSLIRRAKNKKLGRTDITAYSEHVLSAATSLRKQMSHLAPSLKYVRETRDVIDLADFLSEMHDFYTERWNGNDITLELGHPLETFEVSMNRGRLTQIVDNVILNAEYWLKEALRARRIKRGVITVTCERPFLRIADNGVGVDPSVEETLFQPFVSTKPTKEGRGLGLFIVQQLLDSAGGFISLLPDRNGKGNRYIFQISLSGVIHDG